MKRVFLFKTGGFGDAYGIGTYLDSIAIASKNYSADLEFIIVDFEINSRVEFITTQKNKNVTHCKFPITFSGINIYQDALLPSAIYTTLHDHFSVSRNDVFHFNSGMQYDLAKKIKEETDAPIIYTMHIMIWKSIYNNKGLFKKEFADKKFKEKLLTIHQEKKMCRIGSKVICMNSESVEYVAENYRIKPNKILMLPNGLSLNTEQPIKETKEQIKESLDLINKKIIMYVGRIDKEKGIFDLIEAFKLIRKEQKDVKLLIIGDGNLSKALSCCNNIWNDVMFTGYIKDRVQLRRFYKIADIMVLASYHEQSSFTFLEALKNKKPLIVTAIPAFEKLEHASFKKIKLIKQKNKQGLKVDSRQLFRQIKALLASEVLANKIAEDGYELFIREFNLQSIFNTLKVEAYGVLST